MSQIQPEGNTARDNNLPANNGESRVAKRRSSLSGGLALVLAFIALLGTGYLWYVLAEQQGLLGADVAGRLNRLSTTAESLTKSNEALQEQVAVLRETQETLKTTLGAISSDFTRARSEWVLAEAQQLLFIANHRLQLAGDVDLALAALRAADRQLKQLANPNLLPVRRALAGEIDQLESLDRVDFDGLALLLNRMAANVDRLPLRSEGVFKTEERPASEPAPEGNTAWRFGQELWRDIKSMIRVRHDAEVARPLLAPEHEYFLRENLRLTLRGAELALLQRNQEIFRENLLAARKWLDQYFDTSKQAVRQQLAEIDRMVKAPVDLELPDISASLEALNKASARRNGS